MKHWVVLPAYNEEEALSPLLDSLFETFRDAQRPLSVVVVNDGSQDGTKSVLERYAKSHSLVYFENEKNLGLADTIKRGLIETCHLAADNDVIITMDADNTHPAGLALRMSRLIAEGSDVVIASRFREGARIRGLTLGRKLLSIFGSLYFKILFPTEGVRDYTCGYRAYRASVIKELFRRHGKDFISARGFSCMVDILLRLRELDPIFVEVPLILRYDLKPTQSKMRICRTIKDSILLGVKRRFQV